MQFFTSFLNNNEHFGAGWWSGIKVGENNFTKSVSSNHKHNACNGILKGLGGGRGWEKNSVPGQWCQSEKWQEEWERKHQHSHANWPWNREWQEKWWGKLAQPSNRTLYYSCSKHLVDTYQLLSPLPDIDAPLEMSSELSTLKKLPRKYRCRK